jgi:predicted  nucleic acid-binding Zn-ribbon protein
MQNLSYVPSSPFRSLSPIYPDSEYQNEIYGEQSSLNFVAPQEMYPDSSDFSPISETTDITSEDNNHTAESYPPVTLSSEVETQPKTEEASPIVVNNPSTKKRKLSSPSAKSKKSKGKQQKPAQETTRLKKVGHVYKGSICQREIKNNSREISGLRSQLNTLNQQVGWLFQKVRNLGEINENLKGKIEQLQMQIYCQAAPREVTAPTVVSVQCTCNLEPKVTILESQANKTTTDLTSLSQKVLNLENQQNLTNASLENITSILQLHQTSLNNFCSATLQIPPTSNLALNQLFNPFTNLLGHSIQPLPSSLITNSLLSALAPNNISPTNRQV